MSEHVKEATDATFQEMVIEASKTKPVFIDFWAIWCKPCVAFTPIVDAVAEEMHDKISFFKMDADANQNTMQSLEIMAIPTYMIFKEGEMVFRDAGVISQKELTELLTAILESDEAEDNVTSSAE